MGLITCPECQNAVSDKAEVCPKCGYPIAKYLQSEAAQTAAPQNDTPQISSSNEKTAAQFDIKKLPLKKIGIICGAVLLACIAAATAYYFINRENISVSRAEAYTANQEYDKVIDVLEEYKDNPAAKQMYDDAVFMTSEEGQFIIDFADGLKARWDASSKNPDEDLKLLINMETEKLDKYKEVTFDDEVFNQKAHEYITALDNQLKALSYINTDYTQYANLWSDAYSDRSVLIAYFLNNYPVPIDEKYADIKNEFQEAAAGIAANNEFEQKIDVMIHKSKFENTETNSSGWNTYAITLTNETDKTFDYFYLHVNCLDADGNTIKQETTSTINDFTPNQTATFDFTTDTNPQSFSWTAEYYVK